MSKKKFIILIVVAVVGVICIALGASYALFTFNVTKNSNFKTVVGKLELSISDTNTEDRIVMNNAVPKKDSVALEEDGYTFTVTNTGSIDAFYTVYLDDIIPIGETKTRIANNLMHVNLSTSSTADSSNSKLISALNGGVLTTGTLSAGDSINYTLRLWLDYNAGNEAQNKYFASRIRIDSTQESSVTYNTIDKVLAKFKPSELKEVVMCDDNSGEYDNCSIYESIDEAIASRDKGLIVLTSDITRTSTITIAEGKDIILGLNGKSITAGNIILFTNNGNLKVFDSSDSVGTLTSSGVVFRNMTITSNLELTNINVISKNQDNASAICTNGRLIVNNGTYIEGPYGVGCHNADGSTTIINGGRIKALTKNTIQSNSGYNATITINDGVFDADTQSVIVNNGNGIINVNGGTFISNSSKAIFNNSTGTINITGGTFTSNSSNAIDNPSNGTINITQTDKPIYITSLAIGASSVIRNLGTGIVNITANKANQCTLNASDTTSGLCVYAPGDGNLTNDIGWIAIGNDGTVNIDGGTYVADRRVINNNSSSSVANIKNAQIIAGRAGTPNISTGAINICNSTITSNVYDISNASTGTINYNNVTFSNGTNTPDASKIYNPSGTINAVDTCPISE